ncbi:MAG: hypothetical protein AB7V22_00460 [Kiritimatiellia bacterium]
MPSKRFIPGIFNYCDYWCERCAFTRRCRNFQMGEELKRADRDGKDPAADRDAANAAFWSALAEQLNRPAGDWTCAEADDATPEPDPDWYAREENRRAAVQQHPLAQMAMDYMQRTSRWLEDAQLDLQAVADDLVQAARSPAPNDAEDEALEIGDMIEVVTWYHTLLPPKISRALDGRLEALEPEDGKPEELGEIRLEDANGSGRVALLAIERSIAAWVRLREIVPAQEDAILNLLVLLDRLRAGIHLALPGAHDFRLPFLEGEPR